MVSLSLSLSDVMNYDLVSVLACQVARGQSRVMVFPADSA